MAMGSLTATCATILAIPSSKNPRINCLGNLNFGLAGENSISSSLPSDFLRISPRSVRNSRARLLPRASVKSAQFTEEPTTGVKFPSLIQAPGCSSPLSLVGAGYREKVFAIIGVKVYAAGLYANSIVANALKSWKGQPATKILESSTLFPALYEDSGEKSLQIVLVRDVDGQTFWNALNDVISPRIKEPTGADEKALETFRNTFQSRPLNKGTVVLLTWVEPSKLLVSISSEGIPASVDATIDSKNAAFALFDGFFGPSPVSPSLKASVANGIMILLDQ